MTDKNIRETRINPETGEVLGHIYEGDRITRQESLSAYRLRQEKEKELIPWGVDPFYKGYIEELQLITPELSGNEKIMLFSIIPYISYEDCCIKDVEGNDIGTEELVELTGLSRAAVYKTIETLIEKDVIYKGKNSRNRQYFVNPWLFAKGRQINKVLQTMFKNYYIRMYEMTWKQYIHGGHKKIKGKKQKFIGE
jgi:predicted transcriptional regulator